MSRDPSGSSPSGEGSAGSGNDSFLRAIARASVGGPPSSGPDPTQLGHFRILGRLGAGGMGVVYRALDEKLQRNVALKVLPSSVETEPTRRRRFLREARSAAAINHPNIAAVYEVGEAEGRIFIAMELVEGGTLRGRMSPGAMGVDEALRIARELLDALAAAHDKGVIHCDLKPDNVMLDARGRVKVLDFGLAKLREPERAPATPSELAIAETALSPTDSGHVIGTPGYMAPEQADGSVPDARADLFAFGIMLYEMLAGQRPFAGKTLVAVLIATHRDPHPPLHQRRPEVPPALEVVVDRCLEKARERRFSSARDALEALGAIGTDDEPGSGRAARGGRPGAPSGPTLGSRTAGGAAPRGRGRAVLVAGAFGVVVAVAIGAIMDRPRDVAGRAATAASASSGVASGASARTIGLLDVPPPKTKSPKAAAAYERAMTDVRDAIRTVHPSLTRAIELDPEFAAAHLRLAMALLPPASTHRYAEAARYRANLDDRDREILHAEEPIGAGAPPDLAEAERRYAALHAARPRDVEVLMRLASIRQRRDPASARATFAELLVLAPAMAGAELAAGDEAQASGEPDAATAHYQRCVELSPMATDCMALLARRTAITGHCDLYAKEVTRILTLEPDTWQFRADGFSAALTTGAAESDIRAAMEGVLRVDPPAKVALDAALLEGEWALWRGAMTDARVAFERADAHVPELVTTLLPWTYPQRLRIAEEVGDVGGVRSMTREYIGARALTTQTEFDYVALSAIARYDLLPRADLIALRDRWRSDALDLAPAIAWLNYDASVARDEGEARAALASEADASVRPHGVDENARLGHVLLLAKRYAEAESALGQSAFNCALFTGDYSASPWVQPATYDLGLAREGLGDVDGACAAYQKVLDRWGHASPGSTTADAARTRKAALRCAERARRMQP